MAADSAAFRSKLKIAENNNEGPLLSKFQAKFSLIELRPTQAALEGHSDDWSSGDREDDAGEGGGLRVQDDLLQRQLIHADIKVPRRVGKDGQDAIRDCKVCTCTRDVSSKD